MRIYYHRQHIFIKSWNIMKHFLHYIAHPVFFTKIFSIGYHLFLNIIPIVSFINMMFTDVDVDAVVLRHVHWLLNTLDVDFLLFNLQMQALDHFWMDLPFSSITIPW